jgi:hypothetical protein
MSNIGAEYRSREPESSGECQRPCCSCQRWYFRHSRQAIQNKNSSNKSKYPQPKTRRPILTSRRSKSDRPASSFAAVEEAVKAWAATMWFVAGVSGQYRLEFELVCSGKFECRLWVDELSGFRSKLAGFAGEEDQWFGGEEALFCE